VQPPANAKLPQLIPHGLITLHAGDHGQQLLPDRTRKGKITKSGL
jgi:hypothetical protein